MKLLHDHRGLMALLALVIAGHAVLMALPPLNGDEGLYWEWARHLAPGYYSQPPLAGWLIALTTGLLGTFKFTIRLPSLLLHLGTLLLLYAMALELTRNRRFALTATALYAALPISVLLGTLITTDSPLIFSWCLAAWLTKKAVVDGRQHAWYGAGVASGGILLSKLLGVLFFPAVFAFLLAHPRYRGQLARREPYLAFLLALVAFSPFLYWNATHRWLTLQFNLVNRQGATGWHPEKMLEYVAGQMIAASPILLLLMVVAVAAVAIRCWPRAGGTRSAPAAEGAVWNDGLLFYAFVVGVPLLIYLGVSFFARVGAHWAGSVFPLATLLLLVWLCRADGPQPRLPIRRRISYALGLAGLALTSLPLIVVVLEPTVLPDRFVYYDEAHDRQALAGNYYGYEAVGRRIDDLGREWAARPEGFFLSTRDYSLAAQLAFYTPGFPQFVLLGYSESAFHGKEYLMWGRGLKKAGANSLFVLDSPIFPNNADRIVPYCGQVRELEPLVIRDGQGRVLRKFFFALCLDYLANEPDHLSRW